MTAEKIARFVALVEKHPDNPLHNFALAQAFLGAGRLQEAEAAFARCLQLDPTWMVAAIRRGHCLVELQRWDEARAALDLGARLAEAQGHDEPWEEIRALRDRLPG